MSEKLKTAYTEKDLLEKIDEQIKANKSLLSLDDTISSLEKALEKGSQLPYSLLQKLKETNELYYADKLNQKEEKEMQEMADKTRDLIYLEHCLEDRFIYYKINKKMKIETSMYDNFLAIFSKQERQKEIKREIANDNFLENRAEFYDLLEEPLQNYSRLKELGEKLKEYELS